jgi:hypothetical protein
LTRTFVLWYNLGVRRSGIGSQNPAFLICRKTRITNKIAPKFWKMTGGLQVRESRIEQRLKKAVEKAGGKCLKV